MAATPDRKCWCGNASLEPFSPGYRVCRACGTLVSSAAHDPGLYRDEYWLRRQAERGLPGFAERARLDLPERCTDWLRHLLGRRLPPGRVLEVGCAHGGYVALLGWAGFLAVGNELDEAVCALARATFGVDVRAGPVETLDFEAGSFDVIVLNDVIEHLPDPLATLRACGALLSRGGFLVVQTPEYKEHLSHDELRRAGDLFLKHMDGMEAEHLYLFSRRAAGILFARLGLPILAFSTPVYSYDMHFTASRDPLPAVAEKDSAASLQRAPLGRLVLALLDKAYESKDRWWAIQRLEAERSARRGPSP
jgi:SAM-dependent methyltransferase